MRNEFLDAGNESIRAALSRISRGEAELALKDIDKILGEKPHSAAAHRVRAMALGALSRYPDAIAAIRRGIDEMEKDDPAYFFDLGTWLLDAGNAVDAFDAFERSIDSADTTGNSYYLQPALLLRAVAALKSGKPSVVRDGLQAIEKDTSFYCGGALWSKRLLRKSIG